MLRYVVCARAIVLNEDVVQRTNVCAAMAAKMGFQNFVDLGANALNSRRKWVKWWSGISWMAVDRETVLDSLEV